MTDETFLELPSERRKKKKLPAAPRPLQNIGEILRVRRANRQRGTPLCDSGGLGVGILPQPPSAVEATEQKSPRLECEDGENHREEIRHCESQEIPSPQIAEKTSHTKAIECDNQRKFPELLDDFRKLHARQSAEAAAIRSAIAVKAVTRRPACVQEFREAVIEIQRGATELLKWCNRNMGTIGAKDRELRRMGIDPYKKVEDEE